MSLFLSTSAYSLDVWEKKKRHIELLVLSFRPSLGGYRLWQRFIFTPLHPRLCVREFVGECAPMWKSNGNPDLSILPPEPWQRSAGQSRLTHQKLSNQTEMTEAISVARKLHEDEMFTQTWNGIEMKWSQMTPRTCFGSFLQPVLFRALWISLGSGSMTFSGVNSLMACEGQWSEMGGEARKCEPGGTAHLSKALNLESKRIVLCRALVPWDLSQHQP